MRVFEKIRKRESECVSEYEMEGVRARSLETNMVRVPFFRFYEIIRKCVCLRTFVYLRLSECLSTEESVCQRECERVSNKGKKERVKETEKESENERDSQKRARASERERSLAPETSFWVNLPFKKFIHKSDDIFSKEFFIWK